MLALGLYLALARTCLLRRRVARCAAQVLELRRLAHAVEAAVDRADVPLNAGDALLAITEEAPAAELLDLVAAALARVLLRRLPLLMMMLLRVLCC